MNLRLFCIVGAALALSVASHLSGAPQAAESRLSAFFPAQEKPPVTAKFRNIGTTWYIDSINGNNANVGTSPATPWRDFTKVNGKTLGPGEKLLIKRGSVINQELVVSARGSADNWAEIGVYGEGARPIIRRNWDIADRCVLVRDPDFLRISSLVVCFAGKGLIVHYSQKGHAGLVIEDCIAHHIEGLYRPNSHGIPEWLNRESPGDDGFQTSAGIGFSDVPVKDILIRNCEAYQCSSGFRFSRGKSVTVDRVYSHDNYVCNTSPHPYLNNVTQSYLLNSIFDAAGYQASHGTMGIMLANPQGLVVRNCIFRNMPHSESPDEGGVDFEHLGNGCLIDRCTFENNAGPAIEVLGLEKPQPQNVEIMNSRFIQNNWALKHGPSEIFIWGKEPKTKTKAEICISTGTIHDNGYVLLPGVTFFKNEAPQLTSWTLDNNKEFATVRELEKAMPFNRPPAVDAGADICANGMSIRLNGKISDDGRPAGKPLAVKWEMLEGPAPVAFRSGSAVQTMADFPVPGDYLLRLVGDDGELWLSDIVAVHILPPVVSVARAWEFNKPLDKEGWTEVNPGTKFRLWKDQAMPTRSKPVKYVGGGFYILSVENSPDAHLLSPGNLDIDLSGARTVRIRFQNHTPASRMRIRFTTAADGTWDDRKSKSFKVVADDNGPRQYAVDMSDVPGWAGRLKQIRLDISTGVPLTGTCRFDYIWIDDSPERGKGGGDARIPPRARGPNLFETS